MLVIALEEAAAERPRFVDRAEPSFTIKEHARPCRAVEQVQVLVAIQPAEFPNLRLTLRIEERGLHEVPLAAIAAPARALDFLPLQTQFAFFGVVPVESVSLTRCECLVFDDETLLVVRRSRSFSTPHASVVGERWQIGNARHAPPR